MYQMNPWLAYSLLAGQATRDRLREELQAVRGELTGVRQAAEADHAALYEKERLARQHFEERRQGARHVVDSFQCMHLNIGVNLHSIYLLDRSSLQAEQTGCLAWSLRSYFRKRGALCNFLLLQSRELLRYRDS